MGLFPDVAYVGPAVSKGGRVNIIGNRASVPTEPSVERPGFESFIGLAAPPLQLCAGLYRPSSAVQRPRSMLMTGDFQRWCGQTCPKVVATSGRSFCRGCRGTRMCPPPKDRKCGLYHCWVVVTSPQFAPKTISAAGEAVCSTVPHGRKKWPRAGFEPTASAGYEPVGRLLGCGPLSRC